MAGALDLEAFAANLTLLHPAVAEVRPYPGLAESLARLRALLEGSSLWEPGRRGTSRIRSPSAASPAARSSPGRALVRAWPARDRAQRVAGEPARRSGRGSHRLGRQLRDPPAGCGPRLPPDRARPRAHDLGRAAAQAPPGTAHGAPGRPRTAAGAGRELAGRARRHRAGADRGGAPPRPARLLRAGDDHARGGDRGPDDDGPARRAPAGRDGRARRVGGRDRARGRRPGGRPPRPARLGSGTATAHARVREIVPFLAEGDTAPAGPRARAELIRGGLWLLTGTPLR